MQAATSNFHFDAAIPPTRLQLRRGVNVANLRQHLRITLEVYRAPIIWIDKAQIPQLGTLVEICDSRRCQLQNKLRQAVEGAVESHFRGEPFEVVEKLVLRRILK